MNKGAYLQDICTRVGGGGAYLKEAAYLKDGALSSTNHTANDMQLIPIEKISSDRDSIRKAREAFLIQKGRTIVPDGLNIREETF